MIELLKPVLDEVLAAKTNKLYSDFDLNQTNNTSLAEGKLAAVLLPLILRNGVWHLLLTMRSDDMPTHAGQISFPGGRYDANDIDLSHTALRECEEETGIKQSQVQVLGKFDAYHTVTNYHITPFVGIITEPINLKPDPREVAEIFEVPFSFVTDLANYRRDSRKWQGKQRFFYSVPYEDRYIWGATAGILRALALRLADQKTPKK